jgi:hypothetical protein
METSTNVPKDTFDDVERMTGYFEQRIAAELDLPSLPDEALTAKTCGECPSMCMYRDYTLALCKEPIGTQEAYLSKWFCHVDPSRRCRGANAVVRSSRG